MTYPGLTGGYFGAARGWAEALGHRERGAARAVAPLLFLALSGCMGMALSDFDRKLSEADRYILDQCANLDNPVNAARIDALALITTSTQTVEVARKRREAYCEFKRKQTEGLTNDE